MDKYRVPIVIFLALLLAGCGTTLRSGWDDFNAYFNTFYNASTLFDRAEQQVIRQNQREPINAERPIRIHRTPPRVAQQDFEQVILTSADILREHNTSRWVDNAIELIGKSYFYQQQYFSADQKFIELFNNALTPARKQNAILWRGRVFLERNEANAGINYLTTQLFTSDFEWDAQTEAEVKMILAQLYVKQERWELAEQQLAEALQVTRNNQLRFRGSFLHGQILERLQRYDEAFDAYRVATSRSNVEFHIVYHANNRMGIMARNMGDYQWAYDHFRRMSRNDKFFEFAGNIEYEMARTLQASGNYEDAKIVYNTLLRRTFAQPTREGRAKIYYGLAEIYRTQMFNYALAAAYYDSSSRAASDRNLLPENFDAQLLSRSFGDFARLSKESAHQDSLLWLSSLSRAEFDSVIAVVRKRKIAELEQQARDARQTGSLVVGSEDDMQQATEVGENGFLNHLNPQITRQMTQTFQAYWAGRPLVDHWRRIEAVRLAVVESEELEEASPTPGTPGTVAAQTGQGGEAVMVEVDISEVPFTEEDRKKVRNRIAAAEYEIGNVFFLSLNMPDSAARHYSKVVERFPDANVAPQALYILSELHSLRGDSLQAIHYASQLVGTYPATLYARRISERFQLDFITPDTEFTRADTIRMAYNEAMAAFRAQRDLASAEGLRAFRKQFPDADMAGLALYQAAGVYIETGRAEPEFKRKVQLREERMNRYRYERAQLQIQQDSARAMLQDTTLSSTQKEYWEGYLARSVTSPDALKLFPYQGAVWDTTRVILADINQNFASFSRIAQVRILMEELTKPEARPEELDPEATYSKQQVDVPPKPLTSTEDILLESGFQEFVDEMMISGVISVTLIIDEEGRVTEVDISRDYDDLGLTDQLRTAIMEYLRFEPGKIQNQPVRVTLPFDIELHYR